MNNEVYLSRRNLLTLLSKLDRIKKGECSTCTLIKYDNGGKFKQVPDTVKIIAVEDEDYYEKRSPGPIYPADQETLCSSVG